MTCDCKAVCSKNLIPALIAWTLLIILTAVYLFVSWSFIIPYRYIVFGCHGALIIFVVVNFARATFMDPGIFPPGFPDERPTNQDTRPPLYRNVDIKGVSIRMKWCTTCEFYRPPRCSHCSVCKHCIDTFDHHCPWVNNCIGRRNYRYFVVFLLSLTLHMVTVIVASILYVFFNRDALTGPVVIIAMVLACVVGLLLFPVLGLTVFHIFLIVKGRTTNEQVTNKFNLGNNPFDRGCFRNCCSVLCGPQLPSLIRTIKKPVHATCKYEVDHDQINVYMQPMAQQQTAPNNSFQRPQYNRTMNLWQNSYEMYATRSSPIIQSTRPPGLPVLAGPGRVEDPPNRGPALVQQQQYMIGQQQQQNSSKPGNNAANYDQKYYHQQMSEPNRSTPASHRPLLSQSEHNSSVRAQSNSHMPLKSSGGDLRYPPVVQQQSAAPLPSNQQPLQMQNYYQHAEQQYYRPQQPSHQGYYQDRMSPRTVNVGRTTTPQPSAYNSAPGVNTVSGRYDQATRQPSYQQQQQQYPQQQQQGRLSGSSTGLNTGLRPVSFLQAVDMGHYVDGNGVQTPAQQQQVSNNYRSQQQPYVPQTSLSQHSLLQHQQQQQQRRAYMGGSSSLPPAVNLAHYNQMARQLDEQVEASAEGTFEISV